MKLLLFVLLFISVSLSASAQDEGKYKDSIKVVVSFTVDESGQTSDVRVVKWYCNCPKKLKRSITTHVKDIIQKNPFPVKKDKNGNPIKANYLQPITFKLEDVE